MPVNTKYRFLISPQLGIKFTLISILIGAPAVVPGSFVAPQAELLEL
jgi:hypothetical protein